MSSTPAGQAPARAGIDPRGPRFVASITALLLLVDVLLGLIGPAAARSGTDWLLPALPLAQRAGDPAFVLLTVLAALFAWGALAGVQRGPFALLFRAAVRPRLRAPAELEDPRPPTFAQGVGLVVTLAGLVLQLAGVPYGLPAAAAAAFVAAFLNAAFGYCLGCEMYLLLQRLRPRSSAAAG